MNIKGFIFDLGNTLVEIPEEYDEEACLQKFLGYPEMDFVRSRIYNLCFRYPGQSKTDFLRRFDEECNPTGDPDVRLGIARIWERSVYRAVLKEGALDLLDELHTRGFKLALVSNTPPTSHDILDRLQLRKRFDEIVFSCDVGYLKPDPRIFQYALQRLDVQAPQCVVVGDKIRTDILGGAILGMRAILVERRLRASIENHQNYVDAIVCKLSDIYKLDLWKELC